MIEAFLRFVWDGCGNCLLTAVIGITDHILDLDPNDTSSGDNQKPCQ
jgi:hypothetical protein